MTDNRLTSLFRFLIDTLKDEIENHNCLLDIIREEAQSLRESRMPAILDIGLRKGEALRQSEAARQRRMAAATNIFSYLRLDESLPLSELMPYADITNRKILTDYRDKFSDIVRHIKNENEANRQIIALTLSNVADIITFIMNITASLPHYDRQGQISARRLRGEFISRTG
jgi:flagellar biosynthesis/type III secretory pathway chaperone